jgi:SAM-dependent methyltransferase
MQKNEKPRGWDWDEVADGPSAAVGLTGADKLYDIFNVQASAAFSRYIQPDLASGSTLEVGCGKGQWLQVLSAHGFNAMGGDRSLGMLQRAAGIAPLVQFDAAQLPFGKASFDNVFTVTVLQHQADPVPAIGELARVARHRIIVHEMTGSLVPRALTPGTTARTRQWYESQFAEHGWTLRASWRTPRPAFSPVLECLRATPGMLPRGVGLYAAKHEWLAFTPAR